MIRRALTDGWRTARAFWVLALALYLGNLLITATLAWVVAWLLDAASGASLAPSVLVDGYNYTVISDLRIEGFLFGRTALGALLVAAPLSILANVFLTGGIIANVLPQHSRPSLWVFVASAVSYAGRFLRLLLLGLLLMLPVAGGVVLIAAALVPASGSEMTTERILGEAATVGLLVIVALSGIAWMAMDYARILVVRDRARSSSRSLWRALRLVGAHPLATGTIQLAGIALMAMMAMLQVIVGVPLQMDTEGGVLAVVLLHQVVVLARSFIRLALIGSQISVANTLAPARSVEDGPSP